MSDDFKLPKKKCAIFWPVGTGDSTTLVLQPGKMAMQIDLRHLSKAENDEEPEWPIIDCLVKTLPKKGGKPYLATFALTHPDKDHIQGFADLLKKVHIGEIWHTPKIFRHQKDQDTLCDDAKSFRKEVDRRRKQILADPTNVKSGDRLRVIGHDKILTEDKYKGLPDECKSRPGEKISFIDGVDLSKDLTVFIHAPFKEDMAKDKNNTSLSLNVVLWEGEKYCQFFFFGDREYPGIKQIFETTIENKDNRAYLYWNVMLCSHHCSKSIMYWKDEGEEEEKFKADIMKYFEDYSRNGAGYIVSSSHSQFSDKPGDNPPHKKARNSYEKIVKPGHFICTHEYPDKKNPIPVIFSVDAAGFELCESRDERAGLVALGTAVASARGGSGPPATQVGFGEEE